MCANASVNTCPRAHREFNVGAFENLDSELLPTTCLFFHIRIGSASEKIQSGTSQEAEGMKVLAQ